MNIPRTLRLLLVALVLVCSSVPAAQAQDAPNADRNVFLPFVTADTSGDSELGGLVTAKSISPAEQKAALDFWTHEALAAAQPLEMPSQLGAVEVDAAALAEPEASGPPIFVAAGAAAPDADKVAQAAYPSDWAALADEAGATVDAAEAFAPDGTSQVYTSYVVNQVAGVQTLYPHRWIGRISFSTPSGTSYCSGTSIRGNVMLTAAHCLYDSVNNRWYSNWAFTPAYRNGNAPYGTFAATRCWVMTSWINLSGSYSINTWAPHDVGVCKMGNNSAGVTLNGAVGSMGYQANQAYIRHLHSLGYPFRNYNDTLLTNAGLYLRTCVAESFQQAAEVRGMGCNLSRGSSGGPWMTGYALGVVSGTAHSVNSGFSVGTQNTYGGRFNSNNIVPLCSSAGC